MKRCQFHPVPQDSHVQPAIFVPVPGMYKSDASYIKAWNNNMGKILRRPQVSSVYCAFSTRVKIRDFCFGKAFAFVYYTRHR